MTVGSPRDTFWDDAFSNVFVGLWQCLSALSSCLVLDAGDSDPGEGVTCSPPTKELPAITPTPGLVLSKPFGICCVSSMEKDPPILGTWVEGCGYGYSYTRGVGVGKRVLGAFRGTAGATKLRSLRCSSS